MNLTLLLLLISTLIVVVLFFFISSNKNDTAKVFRYNLLFMFIWDLAITFQNLFSERLGINPIYFDYIAYIGICFLPVSFLFTGLTFTNTKIQFKPKYLLLFVIPCISLLMLWTNDYHHLFYQTYSTDLNTVKFGPFLILHDIYTYVLFFISIFLLLRFSIKNSGLFSKQSLLTVLGISIPLVTNILGTLQIISMTIYFTPITFTLTVLFLAIAIFKFQFLEVAPIAIQKVVNQISDSYVVLGTDNKIIDFNKTFVTTFNLIENNLRKQNFLDLLKYGDTKKEVIDHLNGLIKKAHKELKSISFEQKFESIDKYFQIEISPIMSDDLSLGTVFLFKDITQHKHDMKTIKDNQEILMESERLASLGQLVGGIAHNLKTPIMSISGATEGLTDLVNELDASVGNPVVTNDDFHEIANDMKGWLLKIKSYTEYMSDILTAVKGQAVTLSDETDMSFTLEELFKRIDILMKHELKKSVTYLHSHMKVDKDTSINGNANSLVQVINNMISNAIQSYNGKPEQSIDLTASQDGNNIIISIRDYGPGLPEKVQKKLFKEMITTKGKNGTGLGLYMSYSNIKAHFHGDIKFETKKGEGTIFYIILPI